jgi:hypothetical protein
VLTVQYRESKSTSHGRSSRRRRRCCFNNESREVQRRSCRSTQHGVRAGPCIRLGSFRLRSCLPRRVPRRLRHGDAVTTFVWTTHRRDRTHTPWERCPGPSRGRSYNVVPCARWSTTPISIAPLRAVRPPVVNAGELSRRNPS